CNLGPTQTARSLGTADRKQIAWINQRHVDMDDLDQAIQYIINAYNQFDLPKHWGEGKRASADGTMWDYTNKIFYPKIISGMEDTEVLAITMYQIPILRYSAILFLVGYGKESTS